MMAPAVMAPFTVDALDGLLLATRRFSPAHGLTAPFPISIAAWCGKAWAQAMRVSPECLPRRSVEARLA